MIGRRALGRVQERLSSFSAVVLLGPRQVGKTTLARWVGDEQPSVYLDLESPRDRARLADPELYLSDHADKLVILDEIHRVPELFESLRGLIDRGRRDGRATGRFLLLGSASMDLLRQSGESLAGRVAYVELGPLDAVEVDRGRIDRLWLRGGFPDSFLAPTDEQSSIWLENFIRTYLERDIPQLASRVPAETMRRFWTMLAHAQGSLLNAQGLGASLGVDGKTVARYLDLLVDLLLVRRLEPLHVNVRKRLVKSPKTYIRDSGLVHALLGLDDRDALLGHPVAGMSWEGFVIENLISVAPHGTQSSFYRTSAGAEMDLVLDLPGGERWAVEVKRSVAPKLGKGFHNAREDLQPNRSFVVYSGDEHFPMAEGVDAIALSDLSRHLVESSVRRGSRT